MKKNYAIVEIENTLNSMIDEARTPGADLWLIEQQKKSFLSALQTQIAEEVSYQVANLPQNPQIQEEKSPSSLKPKGSNSHYLYEKTERYREGSAPQGGGSWENFWINISSMPFILFKAAIVVFALFGFLHVIFPKQM